MIDHETFEEMIAARNTLFGEASAYLAKLARLKRPLTKHETSALRGTVASIATLVASNEAPVARENNDHPFQVDWQETHDTGGIRE